MMSKKQITVSKVLNEHSNPIAELVQVACRYESNISIESDNKKINAKSIMGVMAFRPTVGMVINITTEGSDEEEALVAMENYLAD